MSEVSQGVIPAAAERLVFDEAEPLIRRIINWRLSSFASLQDREDVTGDVLLDVLVRLADPESHIDDLAGYSAVAAHHGCDAFLRRRFPHRHRLTVRLRYLFDNSPEFAMWEHSGSPVCGLLSQRATAPLHLETGWFRLLPVASPATERAVVAAALHHAGAPIRFDDLVQAVAHWMNIADPAPVEVAPALPAASPDLASRLDQRRLLTVLWEEIRLLPISQRVALLLNLRDDEGFCALSSLPALGVASMRDIALALEMPAEELAALWRSIPLSDLAIAQRLGLTRQQVINARKAARARLSRRIAGKIQLQSPSKIISGGNG